MRKEARPYIIRNSISEHPRENQAGYGFKYRKEDSAGVLNYEFTEWKGEDLSFCNVRQTEKKKKKEILSLNLIYISTMKAN